MTSRPTHFEIPVDYPERAEKFYASVFGWTFQRYPGAPQYYGMATTGDSEPGINGASSRCPGPARETQCSQSRPSRTCNRSGPHWSSANEPYLMSPARR